MTLLKPYLTFTLPFPDSDFTKSSGLICPVFRRLVAGISFLSTSIHSFRLNATGSLFILLLSGFVVGSHGWLCLVGWYILW